MQQKSQLELSKSTVQDHIKEKTKISVDMPDSTGKGGTTTNGNVVHALLSEEKNLQAMVSEVPGEFQDSLHQCLSRSYVILNLYSSSHKIGIEEYKNFCMKTKKNDSNII